MSNQDRQRLLEELAEPVCASYGVELVEVRQTQARGGWTIMVVIDRPRSDGKPGSDVTLEDCTGVSRDLSTALDVHEDLLPGAYHLEVSSPGIERPLVKLADFTRFAGREIAVKTFGPLEPSPGAKPKRSFQGTLVGVAEGALVEVDENGVVVRIPHGEIARANLVHRF
ncbi:MAG: ribosome maturation factor RimP [Sandaracinus sp.]|nr:ribosome maturation factor RimP [Sandaracinus sp.]MCB9623384.1 ribosome maturation factor RimP [Sandaracinus sp.]